MKLRKLLSLLLMVCVLGLLCTSCATTAVSNAQRYLDSSGAILDTLFASTTAAAPSSSGPTGLGAGTGATMPASRREAFTSA